jgi:hypothetical protein
MDKWNLLDEDLRKIISIDSKDVKVTENKVVFKRPNHMWFYNDQRIILHKESIDFLTNIQITINHIVQDDSGDLVVDCEVQNFVETENRRTEFRDFVELFTIVETNSSIEFGTVIDLSKSGAKIELPLDITIEVGNVFTLNYSLYDQKLSRRGVVQWVLYEGDNKHIGVKFFN